MKKNIDAMVESKKKMIESLKHELGNKTLELNSFYQKRIDALLNEIESLIQSKEEQTDEHQENR